MRLKHLNILFCALFLIIVINLGYLQILRGSYYYTRSDRNRIRVNPIKAARGFIYDRHQKVLANNRPSFDVTLIPAEIKDKPQTVEKLSEILGLSLEQILERMEERTKRRKSPPFAPRTIARDIGKEKAIIIEECKLELPGVLIQINPARNYLYGKSAAHLLGYLGRINPAELTELKPYGYQPDDWIGKCGIEKAFDALLKGEQGGRLDEVDYRGKPTRVLGLKSPVRGQDLRLTIDIELQVMLEKLLKNRRGAIVVMNPHNGEILALVSSPGFDPNIFTSPKRSPERLSLIKAPGRPFVNRATSGSYAPGSIFKIVTAASGLELKKISAHTTFFCPGKMRIGNSTMRCWRKSGHGKVEVTRGLSQSCNVFFANTGMRVGVDNLAKYAHVFGLGELTGIELGGENKGLVPTRRWKRLTKKEGWYAGETAHFSIGQGYLEITPLQAAKMVSIIANGGREVQPSMIYQAGGGKAATLLAARTTELIKKGLFKVVQGPGGTGIRARTAGITISGKTGTAEVARRQPHAWFVGYAPSDKPQISFVVFLENGGKGGAFPADMSKKLVEYYFRKST